MEILFAFFGLFIFFKVGASIFYEILPPLTEGLDPLIKNLVYLGVALGWLYTLAVYSVLIEMGGNMNTLKNLCVVIVVAFIIASNPGLVKATAKFISRVVYNTSVIIVEVVGEAADKASKTSGGDLVKEVPDKAPQKVQETKVKIKKKTSDYAKWMEEQMNTLSSEAGQKTTT